MVGRLKDHKGWRATRYWFPTVMLAASALAWWTTTRAPCRDDTVATLCSFFNVPAVIGGSIAALLMAGAGATELQMTVVAIIAAWGSWYAVVRWMEMRRDDLSPYALQWT